MHSLLEQQRQWVTAMRQQGGKKQPNVFDGGGSEYKSDQSRNSQLAWIQVGLFIARGTYAKTKIPHRSTITKKASYNGCFTRIRAIFQDAQGKVWRAA